MQNLLLHVPSSSLEEVLVRQAVTGKHPVECVGPNAPV